MLDAINIEKTVARAAQDEPSAVIDEGGTAASDKRADVCNHRHRSPTLAIASDAYGNEMPPQHGPNATKINSDE